jgi:hypothetical protein
MFALMALAAIACGVESGERRFTARPTPIQEFHRTVIGTLEQTTVDLKKTDAGCQADPADLSFTKGQRVRLALQIPAQIVEGSTGSLEQKGEKIKLSYAIPGLEISNAGGAEFFLGAKDVNVTLESGPRVNFDFNVVNNGTFDIICEGKKVGTLSVAG